MRLSKWEGDVRHDFDVTPQQALELMQGMNERLECRLKQIMTDLAYFEAVAEQVPLRGEDEGFSESDLRSFADPAYSEYVAAKMAGELDGIVKGSCNEEV